MGHARKRMGADGRPRYTAYYDDIRGRQTFRHYVEHEWLPYHVMEASTREGYTYSIYAHLMDTFGPMKMGEILPSHVREWVTAMTAAGMTPATLRSNKAILSAIFTTALNDQVTTQHPCKGVKTPPVPKKPLRIITPEESDTFYAHLPDADAQLLVETAIESGMRWGELTELRPHDLDLPHHLVTVSRTVVQVNDKFHPDGGNFLVKDYPKDREPRRFRLSPQITAKLRDHIRAHAIGPGDLIFAYRPAPAVARRPSTPPRTWV